MLTFGIGLGLLGALIGFLCGFTQSPIVATIVPLLFAMSAAATAWLAPHDKEKQLSMQQVKPKLRLFGLQLVIFSPAFALGMWLGIGAKASPFFLWPRGDDDSIVAAMPQTDPRILSSQMVLEQAMIRSNIGKESRRLLFDQLAKAAKDRSTAMSVVNSKVDSLVSDWDKSKLDENLTLLKQLSERLKNLADSNEAADKASLQEISTQLNNMTAQSGLTELNRIAGLLSALREENKRQLQGLASDDEVAAWKGAIEKVDSLKSDAKVTRSIASDPNKNPDRLPG